jgi:hypothetical protein
MPGRVSFNMENDMKAKDADVVWVPRYKGQKSAHVGEVRVEHHYSRWQDYPGGNSWMPVTYLDGGEKAPRGELRKLLGIFIMFNSLVVRDGINPKRVHEAFLMIDEYRRTISPDIPGSE